ncbi:MAG: hypothetical protein IPI10_14485 [Bacteroidetes bacterium]|nr:hypothetical protein [Bacteroidota bacterium]
MSALNKINDELKVFCRNIKILDSASFIQSLFEMNDVKTLKNINSCLKIILK